MNEKVYNKLKEKLLIAKIDKTPEEFLKEANKKALMFSSSLTLIFLFITKINLNFLIYIFLFFILFFIFRTLIIKSLDVKIYRLRREIDREILFAARYFLLKVSSGVPITQAIYDAAKGYGIASSFFQGIVASVEAGVPIEEALERARRYCPSEYMKKVLTPIIVSLKTGSDVVYPLEETMRMIYSRLMSEVKEYEKKLNVIVLLYLVLSLVIPSLGLAMGSILLTFLKIEIGKFALILLVIFVILLQFVFIGVINSAKPTVRV